MSPFVCIPTSVVISFFFFFNDTATTEIYTLSLHDALPILATGCECRERPGPSARAAHMAGQRPARAGLADRKSTRLNSSHTVISYAVFCLKKKKKKPKITNEYKLSSRLLRD